MPTGNTDYILSLKLSLYNTLLVILTNGVIAWVRKIKNCTKPLLMELAISCKEGLFYFLKVSFVSPSD